jgi:hypothetical protein
LFVAITLSACGATPSPSSSAAIDPGAGWQLATLGAAELATTFSDVIASRDGFLVAGSAGPVGDRPLILNSSDGQAWIAESIDSSFASPARLIAWGDRAIAVGGGQTSRCAHPVALDAWVRAVARSWAEAPFAPVFCAGGNATPLIFRDKPILVGAGTGDQPFLMTSDDGLTWNDAGQRLRDIYPRAAATDGSSLWVFGSGPDGGPVSLHSADGTSFEPPFRIGGVGPNSSVQEAGLLSGAPIAILTVADAAGIARLDATSAWQAEPSVGVRGDDIARIVILADRLVALGGAEDGTPMAWSSADGREWSQIRLPDEARLGTTLTGLAIEDGVVVLVGQVETEGADGPSAVGAIWYGPASLLEP